MDIKQFDEVFQEISEKTRLDFIKEQNTYWDVPEGVCYSAGYVDGKRKKIRIDFSILPNIHQIEGHGKGMLGAGYSMDNGGGSGPFKKVEDAIKYINWLIDRYQIPINQPTLFD